MGDLLQKVMDFLDVQDEEALEFFLENCSLDYDGFDYYGMVRDEESGSYREETAAEVTERRRLQRERWERLKLGEGSPSELLSHRTMKTYIQHLSDNVFTARPLFFSILEGQDDKPQT